MLSERMEKELNLQINREAASAYLYFSTSAYFEYENLKGFAHWMLMQAQEELFHVKRFFDYVNDRGGRVQLSKLSGPTVEWKSTLEAMEDAYKHEVFISKHINDLVGIALEEKDFSTHAFLQWFVNEQIEEEATADEVVQKLRMIGDDRSGLFMFDQELGKRTLAEAPE